MISTERVLYFLIGVFILLLVATIYKMYLVKKDVREGFFILGNFDVGNVRNAFIEGGQEIRSVFSNSSNSDESTTTTEATTTEATTTEATTTETDSTTTDSTTTTEATTTEATTTTINDVVSNQQAQIDILNGKLSDIENNNQRFQNEEYKNIQNMFNEEKGELVSNLTNLGNFHDTYSAELQKLLQNKFDVNNSTFRANQEIQQSRIRALEEEIGRLEANKLKNEEDRSLNQIRSIICRSNSTKLNIHSIMAGRNPTGEFLIFLNDKCLSYKINGAEIVVQVKNCSNSGSSIMNMKFKLKEIKSYEEYNNAIRQEERNDKLLALKNEDIYYPFYLVIPVNYPEKCLYVNDENMLNIKTITKSATNRFRTSKTLGLCKNM